MPNAAATAKPWEDTLRQEDHWWVAGNSDNVSEDIRQHVETAEDIVAIIIIQDCNQGGQYYRLFWYLANSDTRYCCIPAPWRFNTEEGVDLLENEQVVTLLGYRFVVKPSEGTSIFIKLLVRQY